MDDYYGIILNLYLYPTGESDCFEWNTNFYGNDLKSEKRSSRHECQKLCQDTTGCEFFTYDLEAHVPQTCYLKTSANERSAKEADVGYVSGPKFCGK